MGEEFCSSYPVLRWETVGWTRASLVAQLVKNLPAMQETPVWFLGWEDPLEKGLATHPSILGLPWWLRWERIHLQCGRCGFDPWVGKIPWRRAWQPTLVFLPGESHGQRGLVVYNPWGHKELDTTEWLSTAQLTLIQKAKLRALPAIYVCYTWEQAICLSESLLSFFLFPTALGLGYCEQAFSGCGEQGSLFIVVCRLLNVVTSLVAGHGLQAHRPQSLWCMGLAAPWQVESSWTTDRTHALCIGRKTLKCWTTRKVPVQFS